MRTTRASGVRPTLYTFHACRMGNEVSGVRSTLYTVQGGEGGQVLQSNICCSILAMAYSWLFKKDLIV